MNLMVKHAVYGAVPPAGQPNQPGAIDVTQALQQRLMGRGGTVVMCNNNTFGDPAPGVVKNFGAVVNRDGQDFVFACPEGQTIDFSRDGAAIMRPDMWVKFAVYGAATGGTAVDVTWILQELLTRSHVVQIANDSFGGDPAPGVVKHFAAIVSRQGNDMTVACQEGQTIDFS